MRTERSIRFLPCGSSAWLTFVAQRRRAGVSRIVLVGTEAARSAFRARCADLGQANIVSVGELAEAAPLSEPDGRQAVLLLGTDERWLQRQLLSLKDVPFVDVCAPVTRHFRGCRPVFVQSIPKSGTHLLIECLRGMGFADPPSLDLPRRDDVLEDGHFYNLQHLRTIDLAIGFHQAASFLDQLARGVILFILRDPRDVAVSLAHYLAEQSDYHLLAAWMRERTADERLNVVLRGEYPIPVYINRYFGFRGTIRELMLAYTDWIRTPLPNVHFVCFEHLVGAEGGGSADRQHQALWELQLALHVPGSPDEFADHIFSREALTFRQGQIGSFKNEFAPEHDRLFSQLPHDFMELTGYAIDRSPLDSHVPQNPEFTGMAELRGNAARPCAPRADDKNVLLPAASHATTDSSILKRLQRLPETGHLAPVLVEHDFHGFNLLRAGVEGIALAASLGDVDWPDVQHETLETWQRDELCLIAPSVVALRKLILSRPPRLIGEYEQFRLVSFRGRFLAVAKSLGPVDLPCVSSNQWRRSTGDGQIVAADTLERLRQDLEQRLQPRLLKSHGPFNLVAWRDRVYAIAQRLGPFDLRESVPDQRAFWIANQDLIIADTLEAACRQVDQLSFDAMARDIRRLQEQVQEQINRLSEAPTCLKTAVNSRVEHLERVPDSASQRISAAGRRICRQVISLLRTTVGPALVEAPEAAQNPADDHPVDRRPPAL
jgi:hypothetical protein